MSTVREHVASLTTTSVETERAWILRAMLEPEVRGIVGRITTDDFVTLAEHLATYTTERVGRQHGVGLDLGVSIGKGLEAAQAQEDRAWLAASRAKDKKARKKAKKR